MKKIKLTQGQYAIVDDEDYEWLNKHNWCAAYAPNAKSYYAMTSITKESGGQATLYMHRLVMNTKKGSQVDHKNRDALDNRKKNLRLATHSQNCENADKQKNNTSGYKGVFWSSKSKKWRAIISFQSNLIHLGLYNNKDIAALAYNVGAKEYHGEYARLNNIYER